MEAWWQESTEHRNEAGAEEGLEEILSTVKVGHDHVLPIVDTGQGDVYLAVYSLVRILWQILLEALQQNGVDVEPRTESAKGVGAGLLADP